ncbi:hypothetical protein E4656_04115 [Natronospirillum operosum]|uniref:DUF3352 domain-containing protein n=1 Tax=Natronospirillum operosum TaxID=2759953 RepID=A0A4Z0WII0_9GAMM|nr:hypothetical protein [Natronospirillum operosum]TGG95606.1 hypothetical protein E4656_04115 [Natronospirillum operosum]
MTLISRLASTAVLATLLSATGFQALLADTNPHLADIPADSLFHYQTRLDDLVATQSLMGDIRQQTFLSTMQDLAAEDIPLFVRLQAEVERLFADGPDTVESTLGLDPQGWLTAYHAGLVAVIRVDLTSDTQLLSWLSEQGLPVATNAVQETAGGRLYPLNNDPAVPIHSHLWVSADTARFMMSPGEMTGAQIAERLEESLQAPSFADSGRVDDLISRHSLTGSDFWWFDYAGLTRAVLAADNPSLTQDLKRFVPEYRTAMDDPDMALCRAELIDFAEVTPEILWGMSDLTVQDGQLQLDRFGVLTLSDAQVLQELAALEGRLPVDLDQPGDSLLRMGLTLNVNQLGDTLLAWRNRAINADWTCPPLVELQSDLADINMAAVLAGSAMAQGAEGLILELFDMDLQAAEEEDWTSFDGLLAIRAENPQRLAMILAEALELPPGFQVPDSGDSATLPLPDAPMQVRISGDYLVVYHGEQARNRALVLGSVEHRNALFAGSMDLPGFVRHLEDLPMDSYPQPATGGMDMAGNCDALMNLTDMANHLEHLDIGGWLGMAPDGLALTQTLQVQPSASAGMPIQPGRYQLSYFEECSWFDIGEDYLGTDGQAEYAEIEGNCSVFEERFEWSADNRALIWGPREARERNSCQDDFSPWEVLEAEPVRCEVVRREPDGSFQCISQDDYSTRYRYRRLN